MVFIGANRLLGWIGSVVVWRNQLVTDIFLSREDCKTRRTFVVQELDGVGEAATD